MRFLIITGMSGAGKTQVMHFLEDIGYYCIDNLPVGFLLPFSRMCNEEQEKFNKVCVVMDTRGGESFSEIGKALGELKNNSLNYEILFLEADDSIIIKRYKETRRVHPLSPEGSVEDGILLERDRLSYLRENATRIIDTSYLLTKELKKIITDIFGTSDIKDYFKVQVQSFGFKYGIPRDVDLLFDVRFLPNPFYVPELKEHNGTEKEVYDFVFKYHQTNEFVIKLKDMLLMLIPHYIEEGKHELVVGIGCTGGKHRSVAITEKISQILSENAVKTALRHRDIAKE